MSAANIVPHLLAPQELQTEKSDVEVKNNTKLLMKSASMTEDSRGASVKGDECSSSVEAPHRRGTITSDKPKLDRTPLKG